jgi:hypothetical protein
MKRKSYGDLMSAFDVIAVCNGIELGRCRLEALNEHDARVDGWDRLTHDLKLSLFDETVQYRVERAHAART